jgi:ribosomal protein S18 acetylase RimI-like enzyme
MEVKSVLKEKINIRILLPVQKERLIEAIIRADDRSEQEAKEKVEGFLGKKNKMFLVAFLRKKIVGYVSLKKEDRDVCAERFVNTKNLSHVSWIAVLPEFRNTGIGTKLLKIAEKNAKTFGKSGIWLDCRKNILPFYIHNGYSVSGSYIDEQRKRSFVMFKKFDDNTLR